MFCFSFKFWAGSFTFCRLHAAWHLCLGYGVIGQTSHKNTDFFLFWPGYSQKNAFLKKTKKNKKRVYATLRFLWVYFNRCHPGDDTGNEQANENTVIVLTAEVKYWSCKIALKTARDGEKNMQMTQLTFSSNFYWKICFKFCILEQIIATVLFICISSINNKRSLLRFQSTTAPTNRGWSACGDRHQIYRQAPLEV